VDSTDVLYIITGIY